MIIHAITDGRSRGNRSTTGNPRPGSTLVELIVVISISGLVIGLITSSLMRVMTVVGKMRQNLRQSITISQLGDRFRSDLSDSVVVDMEPTKLALSHGSGTHIEYSYSEERGEIQRVTLRDASVLARESYSMQVDHDCRFQQFDRNGCPCVTLQFSIRQDASAQSAQRWTLLGRPRHGVTAHVAPK
jgi:type II secretory pathway pseudopilin PulG